MKRELDKQRKLGSGTKLPRSSKVKKHDPQPIMFCCEVCLLRKCTPSEDSSVNYNSCHCSSSSSQSNHSNTKNKNQITLQEIVQDKTEEAVFPISLFEDVSHDTTTAESTFLDEEVGLEDAKCLAEPAAVVHNQPHATKKRKKRRRRRKRNSDIYARHNTTFQRNAFVVVALLLAVVIVLIGLLFTIARPRKTP